MKKTVTSLLTILLIIGIMVSLVSAGTSYFSRALPANGSVSTVGFVTKTTDTNGSFIKPSYSTGVLKAVKCRTKAKIGGGQIIYSNPVVEAPKGSSTWLGAYIALNLYAGQEVALEMWTNTIGIADTTSGSWDYK